MSDGIRCTCGCALERTLLGCRCVACGLTYEVCDEVRLRLWCPRERKRFVPDETGRLVPEVEK